MARIYILLSVMCLLKISNFSTKATLIAIALNFHLQIYAQQVVQNLDTVEQSAKKQEDEVRLRISDAKAFLMTGRDDDAETRVGQGIESNQQTSETYQSKAADFLRVASSAQLGGDVKTVEKAVRHALRNLEKAEALSQGDPANLAGIAELRGYIKERLIGSSSEALIEYKAALAIKPDSESARNKASLLQKSSDEAASAIKTQVEVK